MGSIVLLDLMGGVALLLWGLHMVLSGVLRAFGPDLRRFLGKALGNRFTAFGAGLGLTALIQSSTATGLMTTSLAADGVVSLVPALAIMLGANVGTTLIVQVLSFNITAAAPALFIIGLVTFRARRPRSHPGAWTHRHWAWADAFGAAHSGRYPGAGRAGARGARPSCGYHARSGAVHRDRGGSDMGGAFKRCRRASHHVACVFAFCQRRGRARFGAGGQSRQRDQSAARRRHPRRSGKPSLATRQSDQPCCRDPHRATFPAADGARIDCIAARRSRR